MKTLGTICLVLAIGTFVWFIFQLLAILVVVFGLLVYLHTL